MLGCFLIFLVLFFYNCKIIKCWIKFHQCCAIPQEKGAGRLLETHLNNYLNSCACSSVVENSECNLPSGRGKWEITGVHWAQLQGRREQVGVEDGYFMGSLYTIIESFKIFLEYLKSDGLLIGLII